VFGREYFAVIFTGILVVFDDDASILGAKKKFNHLGLIFLCGVEHIRI
jgi:hypothetical protein|tara:strand:+ start:6065 stop:6208 length:144 start_codon:yes stop_codon:yes gene_type:complete